MPKLKQSASVKTSRKLTQLNYESKPKISLTETANYVEKLKRIAEEVKLDRQEGYGEGGSR